MKQENNDSKICPICGRSTHKESKYCIFHASAEEKTEEEFKKALKEYVQEIKEVDKNYNFEKFIFIGSIYFRKSLRIESCNLNIISFKNANFIDTTFEGKADFSNTIFKGDAYFSGAIFRNGGARFVNTTFNGKANFNSVIFKGNAYFLETIFKDTADFIGASFKEDSSFVDAAFNERAIFSHVIFKNIAYFDGTIFKIAFFEKTTFKGGIRFDGATFQRFAYFEGSIFQKNTSFKYAILPPGNQLNIKVKGRGTLDFDHSNLENVFLDLNLEKGTLIDFTNTLLRNTKIKKSQIEKHILQEEKKQLYQAKEIYLLLKNNFQSIGQYEDANWAFKKEKDMERKSNCHFKTLHKWIWSCFLNGIFGYGIQPSKVIISAILIITLFAFLFMRPGITNVVGIEEITSNNFFDCIYFSTITFTTLGYGDFRPLEGLGRILAGSEAFIGAFIMALFVYTFARRTGGR